MITIENTFKKIDSKTLLRWTLRFDKVLLFLGIKIFLRKLKIIQKLYILVGLTL